LDDILLQMRKRTREYIKYSARKGVAIRVGSRDDLPGFCSLMRITGRRGHFPARARLYYEQEWQAFADNKQNALLMATYQDQLLAVHMAYCFGDRAAYFHGGSSNDHAELRPNYLLVWEAIKWAKEQGCRTYDLWGIPDEVGQVVSEGKSRLHQIERMACEVFIIQKRLQQEHRVLHGRIRLCLQPVATR
jgi:lipid II:glycine glycyltransferase (peptidoglycan interpeptide bridge formation enzyme)